MDEMIKRIMELMHKSGMTAKELTEKLGVNGSTISEWKKGKTRPSVEHVRRMAALFDVTCDYIINGTVCVTADDYTATKMDMTMLSVLMKLNHEHRDAVRDFMYMCNMEFERGGATNERAVELLKNQMRFFSDESYPVAKAETQSDDDIDDALLAFGDEPSVDFNDLFGGNDD